MKNLRITVLTLVLLAATALSASAQTKVATVDMKKIFNSYWKTKQATIALENRKTELRMEMKKSTGDLEKAQTDYKTLLDQSNDQAISADERAKRKDSATAKAKEIANSKIALEQFQRQAEAQLADQSQRMSGNLVTEIQGAVSDKATAGGYSVVLTAAAQEVVVFADPKVDITDTVISQLNAGAPIDLTKPTTGVPLNSNTNL